MDGMWWLNLLAAAMALALWGAALPRLRGTTLVAPWGWCGAALALVCGVELAAPWCGPTALDPWRFVAGCATCCPTVAVLGAKRPQDRAWWVIVATLAFMLALPALENWALQPGQRLEMGDARGWFLLGLVGFGVAQQLPTAHAMSGLLLGAGQLGLLHSHLPGLGRLAWPEWWERGAPVALLAALAWASRPRRRAADAWDQAWLDFRDSFGMVWGLRIAERINAAARAGGWGWELTWSGWRLTDEPRLEAVSTADIESARRTTLTALLRRFVAPDWLPGT